jgi:hypothetical protein
LQVELQKLFNVLSLGRLNKIGKNPCLVSNKENLSAEDSKTVDAFLKALATKESVDSFDKPSTPREHSPFFTLFTRQFFCNRF